MKTKNTQFGIFTTSFIGEMKTAKDIHDLLENKMLKRWSNWQAIKWKEDGQTIILTEHFLDEGMTIEECIEDHKIHGELDEDICVLDWKGTGTVNL